MLIAIASERPHVDGEPPRFGASPAASKAIRVAAEDACSRFLDVSDLTARDIDDAVKAFGKAAGPYLDGVDRVGVGDLIDALLTAVDIHLIDYRNGIGARRAARWAQRLVEHSSIKIRRERPELVRSAA